MVSNRWVTIKFKRKLRRILVRSTDFSQTVLLSTTRLKATLRTLIFSKAISTGMHSEYGRLIT